MIVRVFYHSRLFTTALSRPLLFQRMQSARPSDELNDTQGYERITNVERYGNDVFEASKWSLREVATGRIIECRDTCDRNFNEDTFSWRFKNGNWNCSNLESVNFMTKRLPLCGSRVE